MIIYDKIAAQVPAWQERVRHLVKEHGAFKVCDVTVEQIYGGIRGVQIQVSDISYVDPYKGIRLRGYTIPEVLEILPKAPGSQYPLAGGLYYLLMTNEVPNEEQAWLVEDEWKKRSAIPPYVFDVIKSMPPATHPMTLFSQAVLAMQYDSLFSRQLNAGVLKNEYWKWYLEDSLNLTARLPGIAAYIYNKRYRGADYITPRPDLDWSANFAYMIGKGKDKEYMELSRLFLVLHSDHEGGNVSAHAAHLVGSALSDVYYATSAGLNGLAGPLHGLANQECIRWLLDLREHFGGLPTEEQFEAYAWQQLAENKLIPGYGHAVLRTTDPRFTAQLEFGEKYMPDDELFQLVKLVFKVLPGILIKHGKAKNPYPNVDAINGTMQYHFGVTQFDFYTVLFGLSRALGFTAHLVWARVLGKPIERPKSLTTRMLEDMVMEGRKD
ncbi:MAG TPA: citrate (Si)-synthase [Anaerolineaceae bacterium]